MQKSLLTWRLNQVFANNLPLEQHGFIEKKRYQNITLVLSIEGVNPPIATSPSVKYVFPKFKQQLTGRDLMMDAEMSEFFAKNDKIMLVAFGTEADPGRRRKHNIMEFMKMASSKHGWAFVYADRSYNMTATERINFRKRYPKILIQKFVPQITILDHPHTKVFMTHGGSNSV